MSSFDLTRFAAAEHGVRWALSNLPDVVISPDGARSGELAVSLSELSDAEGPDDWSLRFAGSGVSVTVVPLS